MGLSKEKCVYSRVSWSGGSPGPSLSDSEPALVGVDAVGRFLHGRHGAGHGPVVPGRLPLPRPPVFRRDERHGVGLPREHVDRPFAAASHMLLRQSPVVVERALDHGVDAALQLVGRRRQWAAALEDGRIAEREQHAGPVQPDQSEVGAAQAFVRPPPLASPRVHGILFGDGVLLEVIVVSAVPVVELLEPCGGLVGRRHPDEPAGESEQPPAGLAPGPVRQVDAGVAQHMHQAALHGHVHPPPFGGLAHGLLARHPREERAELRHASRIIPPRRGARPAAVAPPPLRAGARETVPAHRAPAQRAPPRPRGLVPAHGTNQHEKSSTRTN